MIAAIYARKSTDQDGVAEDAKSVTRQIENATAFITSKGWTLGPVFADDGISGAEFAKLPDFLRLLNSLKPYPPFQALVMSEGSRLGREQIETACALKLIITSGVQVWTYLDERQRTLDSPIEKAMMAIESMADEIERDKARQRVRDAMMRKARAGYVTGGIVFGYDNVPVLGAGGKRAHVVRAINETQATVIRRMFSLSANGTGYSRTSRLLNHEGAPAPRPKRGRSSGWSPSTVRVILHRRMYLGNGVYNKN